MRRSPGPPKKPQRAPKRNESRGWGPLKESRKQQPALHLDDHALRARGTVADDGKRTFGAGPFAYLGVSRSVLLYI